MTSCSTTNATWLCFMLIVPKHFLLVQHDKNLHNHHKKVSTIGIWLLQTGVILNKASYWGRQWYSQVIICKENESDLEIITTGRLIRSHRTFFLSDKHKCPIRFCRVTYCTLVQPIRALFSQTASKSSMKLEHVGKFWRRNSSSMIPRVLTSPFLGGNH